MTEKMTSELWWEKAGPAVFAMLLVALAMGFACGIAGTCVVYLVTG